MVFDLEVRIATLVTYYTYLSIQNLPQLKYILWVTEGYCGLLLEGLLLIRWKDIDVIGLALSFKIL